MRGQERISGAILRVYAKKVSGSLCPSLAGRYQRKAVLHKFHNIGMKMAKLFNHQRSISCSLPSVA